MNIEVFREFISLSESLNYQNTASILFTTQATLSRHIIALEQELGYLLFNRNSKGVSLTPAAMELLPYAKELCSTYDEAVLACTRAGNEQQDIRIGYCNAFISLNLLHTVCRYRKSGTDCRTIVFEEENRDLIPALLQHQADFVIVREFPDIPVSAFNKLKISATNLVVLLSKKHPLADHACIELSELRHERFATNSSKGEISHHYSWIYCMQAGFEPNIAYYDAPYEAMVEHVQRDQCAALVWKQPFLAHIPNLNPEIAVIELSPVLSSQLSFVYKESDLNENMLSFLSYMKHELSHTEAERNL